MDKLREALYKWKGPTPWKIVATWGSEDWASICKILAEEEAIGIKIAPENARVVYIPGKLAQKAIADEAVCRKLGLRSTRFINQPEWNGDYD